MINFPHRYLSDSISFEKKTTKNNRAFSVVTMVPSTVLQKLASGKYVTSLLNIEPSRRSHINAVEIQVPCSGSIGLVSFVNVIGQ